MPTPIKTPTCDPDTTTSPHVAWIAHDTHDDKSVLFFSAGDPARVLHEAAQRLERDALDSDDSCDEPRLDTEGIKLARKPPFDRYASQGFVPTRVLLVDGWWFECKGCEKHVMADDDFVLEGRDRPGHRAAVFHNVFCAARYAAKQKAERWKELFEIQRARQRFPDAERVRPFRNDSGTVELTMPGQVSPVIEVLGPVVTCLDGHAMHACAVYDDDDAEFQPALRCTGRGCTAKDETRVLQVWEIDEMDRFAKATGDCPQEAPVTLDLARPAAEPAPCVLCGVPCDAVHVHVHPTCVDDETSAQALAAVLHARPSPANPPVPERTAPEPDVAEVVRKFDEQGARVPTRGVDVYSTFTHGVWLAKIAMTSAPAAYDLNSWARGLVRRLCEFFENPKLRCVLVYAANEIVYVATRGRPDLTRALSSPLPLHFYRTDNLTGHWFCVSRADAFRPGALTGVPVLDGALAHPSWTAHAFSEEHALTTGAAWTADILHEGGPTSGCAVHLPRKLDAALKFTAMVDFLQSLFVDARVVAVRLREDGRWTFVATREALLQVEVPPYDRSVESHYFDATMGVALRAGDEASARVPWFWVYRTDRFPADFTSGRADLDALIRD